MDKIDGARRVVNIHREIAADRQAGDIDLFRLKQLHFHRQPSVSRMVDLFPVHFNDKAARDAAVANLSILDDGVAMPRGSEFDLAEGEPGASSDVHPLGLYALS